MQQADRAHSATGTCASPGNDHEFSGPSIDRRSLILGLAAAPAILRPSSWFEPFDAATWVERWYRAGHRVMADPSGQPMLCQTMDADEDHAARMRAELGWPGNRHALCRYLARFAPVRPGAYGGFGSMAA